MKIRTLVLFICALASTTAYSQNAKLSLDIQNKSIKEVLYQIEAQSKYRFIYESHILNLDKLITLQVEKQTVENILPLLFKTENVKYEITKNNLILIHPSTTSSKTTEQLHKVQGIIVDNLGEPIIGATVMVVGTQNGIISDYDGKFQIEARVGDKLQIKYIGYTDRIVNVDKNFNVRVVLTEDVVALNDVVVIGYGTVRKRDLTGSVSSIKSEEIKKMSSSNALQAMQAKVPGLDLYQNDGQAGAAVVATLRGNRSITASNSPLILVDGVEYGSTIDINPSDIESMDVLKDASSTAIYGTRGANGVILITTKRGESGKTKVNANMYYSINTPTYIPKVMVGMEEVNRRIDARKYVLDVASGEWGNSTVNVEDVLSATPTNGLPFSEMDIYHSGEYTGWTDEILQTGATKNIEASVLGGSQSTTFNLSVGAMFEEGLLRNDKLDRYNARINVNHKVNKHLQVGSNIQLTYRNHDARSSAAFSSALIMTSLTRPYYDDGTIIPKPSPTKDSHSNPLLDEIEGNYVNNNQSVRLFGNVFIEAEPIKNLKFRSSLNVDLNNGRTGIYEDYQSITKFASSTGGSISRSNSKSIRLTWDNTFNYTTDFGGTDHGITALLGHSMYQTTAEASSIYGATPLEHFYVSNFYDLNNISGIPALSSGYSKQALLSLFGRINYKFKERYLLTASLRADGSSVLAKGNKWGYFPSVALAWRIKEEPFMSNLDWLSNLKLRVSWGISGNAAVSPYQTMPTLGNNEIYYTLDGSDMSGRTPKNIGNKNLTWEKTSSYNWGLDFGIWRDRISGSIDAYISRTHDLLYYKSLPASSVYPQVLDNIGKTKGYGVEIALNTRLIEQKNFSWTANWSASFARDKITQLNDGQERNITGTGGQIVGEPLKIYYYFKQDGCWDIGEFEAYKANWEVRNPGKSLMFTGDPGTIKILDLNDDGKLNDEDKVVYRRSPNAVLGMNNSFTYKDLSLSVLLYARLGGYMSYEYNGLLNYDASNWGVLDYWTPENTDAKFPNPGANSSTWSSYGTAAKFEKASFIKIKDITLSYNLPQKVISKIGFERINIYGSLKNFFTFSKIDNYDPERGGAYTFPLAKQIVFGMNVEF